MIKFSLIVKGFDNKEYGLIERIIKVLSMKESSKVRYELLDLSKAEVANCIILNQDAEGEWHKQLQQLRKNRVHIDVILVVDQVQEHYNHIQRPLTVNKFIKALDEVVVKQLNYVPDLVIGAEGSTQSNSVGISGGSQSHRIFSRRAMVVDDSEPVLKGMKTALNLQDFHVDAVSVPHQALDNIERYEYQIIFLDIMMPGMNGYDLAKEIRKLNKIVPVVMLTSKNSPLDKVRATLVGTNHFITKPVTNEMLLEILEKFDLKKISLS